MTVSISAHEHDSATDADEAAVFVPAAPSTTLTFLTQCGMPMEWRTGWRFSRMNAPLVAFTGHQPSPTSTPLSSSASMHAARDRASAVIPSHEIPQRSVNP